ncbi:MAG TPA: hypothetical protein EYN38_02100 [Flavobacteriales bacterium]|nr:hypothetical protein [Flavobacteriales bacterium]
MKNDIVFDLIKSMTQAEKRYFKRHATLHSEKKENKYVRLFDLMAGQNEFIRSALEKSMDLPNFAQEKRHLYTRLLASLSAFRRGASVDERIGTMLNNHRILRQKGARSYAAKELKRAKKLAEDTERYHDLIKISQMETSMYRDETNLKLLEDHLGERAQLLHLSTASMQLDIEFEIEYLNMVKWNKEIEVVRTPEEAAALDKIIEKPIFYLKEESLSSKSKIYKHYIMGLFHFFKNDFTNSGIEFEKQLAIFTKFPHNREMNPTLFLRSLGNQCLLSSKRKRHLQFNEDMETIKLYEPPTSEGIRYRHYLIHMLEIMTLVDQNDFSGAVNLIESKQEHLQLHSEANNMWYIEWMYVCFNTASAYIGIGDYQQALRYLNEFLNTADPRLKQDTYCIARVINLLLHFELDNRDLLEHQLESTKRYLKSRKRLFKFERAVLQFIRKSLNETTAGNSGPFRWLKKELAQIQKDPLEKNVFAYFNFMPWLDRKVD